MALSWNEIKDRALNFSKEWANTANEEADAKPFLVEFFNVFGISSKRVSTFEHRVKKLDDRDGYIDLLWKGTILIEMKSRGKNLDRAYHQAIDYTHGLKQHELPKFILVSDFENFRLYDMEAALTEGTESLIEFKLADLVHNVQHFGCLLGYQKKIFKEQDPANIQAAELMGKLHDRLKEIGYEGHPLEVYLVRILFLLFAEDTTIFNKQQFQDYIEQRTNEDGSDLAAKLQELFQVLNTPKENRFRNLDEQLAEFPYVNGKLFEEILPTASFDRKMRLALLECCYIDWSKISPAIFGSMFQSVMNPVERRNLGAHYTSEKNIMKLIKPLFLDELWKEFESIRGNHNKLPEFHRKLSTLKFLDPACGCGNFLVITYRELRLLELEILRELYKSGQTVTNVDNIIWLNVDQFYGIEYEEFPARIAEVAMWLIDHQMNMLISNEFGQYFARLPLKKAANITHGDALQIDWQDILLKSPLERGFRGVSSPEIPAPPKRIIIPYNPILKEYARSLRNHSTKSEIHFWTLVKGKYNGKYDFHRQKPLLEFIADFFCYELRLIVEIDGITHSEPEQIQKDLIKENELNKVGLNVLRFTDEEVLTYTDYVMDKLNEYIACYESNSWNEFDTQSYHLNKLSRISPELVMVSGINEDEEIKNTPLIAKNTPLNPLSRGDFKREDFKRDNIKFDYIMGNPPFIGYSLQTKEQKKDMDLVLHNLNGAGALDYVAAWFVKAARYIQNTKIKVAFVSTNSISQGEQVGILWNEMINKYKINIFFGHRTFKWNNEARGQAAVHVIITGFSFEDVKDKYIFDYENIKGDAEQIKVSRINPYLIEANNIFIQKLRKPICDVPEMIKGSSPTDGGFLLISNIEKEEILIKEPELELYIKPFIGSQEFINNIQRWCFWLKNANPKTIKNSKILAERLESVKKFRFSSSKIATKKWAEFPTLFIEERQPKSNYLLIPRVSSENRNYIPIGYLDDNTIISDSAIALPNASLYLFGHLTSEMHMAWVKYVCGRLKSDFRYSNTIVYNNYPFPQEVSDKQKERVEAAAQAVLDARAKYPDSSLADLYDPLAMPPDLVKAHKELDKAVDLCYRPQAFAGERSRIEFLFDLYEKYTANLFTPIKEKKKRAKK